MKGFGYSLQVPTSGNVLRDFSMKDFDANWCQMRQFDIIDKIPAMMNTESYR